MIARIACSRSTPIVRQYQSSEVQRGRFSSVTIRSASSRVIVPLRTWPERNVSLSVNPAAVQ
jgi:hypothetical protein